MPLRLTGTVAITLARNYHLGHQTVLRIYNTHLVLKAKMEGESSHYSLRCGTWFICDLFPSAKTPQSKQAHHCQTAKMCPDENKMPISKWITCLHRCFTEHFRWENPKVLTSNNQNYVSCHLLQILLRSHESCRRNHLSSVFRKGLQRQDWHQCDRGEVLITNIVTHEMEILSKDTRARMCHWAPGPKRSTVIYTTTQITQPKALYTKLSYKYISFSGCKREKHKINQDFSVACFWTMEVTGKHSSFQGVELPVGLSQCIISKISWPTSRT